MYRHDLKITRSFSGEPTQNPLDYDDGREGFHGHVNRGYYYDQGGECPPHKDPKWKSCTAYTRYLHSLYPGRAWEPLWSFRRDNIPTDLTTPQSDVPPFVAYEHARTAMSTLSMNPHLGEPGFEWIWRPQENIRPEPVIDDVLDGMTPRRSELPAALRQWGYTPRR
jgi:hypothetical protein